MIHVKHCVLASGSAARKTMLAQAGFRFDIRKPEVDERALEQAFEQQHLDAKDIAIQLARAKAQDVARQYSQSLVIGSDQVLMLGSQLFAKPATLVEAKAQLQRLSGQTHALHSAVSLINQGDVVFETTTSARMSMWAFDDTLIERYLAHVGHSILGSVGCYHYEGAGIRLFERVEGDYHTILGMPLLPLLSFLRHQGWLSYGE